MRSRFMQSTLLTTLSFVFLLSIVAKSVFTYQEGARFEAEHRVMIPHFLSDKPILIKVFDIMHTEVPSNVDNFTARELS